MSTLRPSLVLLAVFTLLTGALYPVVVTFIGQALFSREAHGSLIVQHGHVRGSQLIGQPFQSARYFASRPSATAPTPYNAASSSGSNQGPQSPGLAEAVAQRVTAQQLQNGEQARVPVDLVTASASGLDPHISPAAAFYQVARVAKARGLDVGRVRKLVDAHVEPRGFGLLGEPRVNVLLLNLALDGVQSTNDDG